MKLKIQSKKIKGKYIYGEVAKTKNSTTLIVFLSGLSGNDASDLTRNASDVFVESGFDTLKLNFCNDDNKKNRKAGALEIYEMSLSLYVAELKNILDTVAKTYVSIIFVAHSFGAPIAISFLNKYPKYKTEIHLTLWDPSLLPWGKEVVQEVFAFNPTKKLFYQKETENPLVINKTFYTELLGTKNTAHLLRGLGRNVIIIAAEKGAQSDARSYFSKISNKKASRFFVIKRADHLFTTKRAQKELLSRTLDFLKR